MGAAEVEVGMGMGWYGPLINLSAAISHVGHFVQLIVFVHRSTPLRYKLARGGDVVRTDIDVGDETRPFFSISLWNKHLASSVSAGDILFFRNVKVIKFRSMLEARTVQYSSILRLIHPYSSLLSRGVDDLMSTCPVVGNAKDKLRRVIQWVQQTKVTLCNEPKSHHIMSNPRKEVLLKARTLVILTCKMSICRIPNGLIWERKFTLAKLRYLMLAKGYGLYGV